MLNIFARASVSRVTDPIGAALVRIGLTPNAMTLIGTTGALVCALAFFPSGMLLWGTFTVWGFVMLDLLDGAMARARGSTPFGAVLDATCDRLVDGALFAAIAWWAFAVEGNERIAVAALISLVLAQVISYVKARAEASGFTSADGGLVERAERLIIALVGTGLQGLGVSFAVEVSQWLLVALSAITFLQRIVGVAHSAREPRS
ncbi:phosphatidylinositol phosphate synthase [Prauserella rugosa]|uniref:Phosphatidylinositol phosphate synthase n=1 Tax=Prauserella rugosa TaxID=43354 RepID=A0A660CCW9_9PSEU|nr:CDP-alcohol phosphatidyltransferase family protein [Prauserella rugosa]KMS84180.1 phosphatidylglycerophosphate synthase [Streptomyces regensis]TWH19767.1 CDP-diacylglycerol--glycerol-3-phosphate 3-phosphatidyltransferase [Prauserella rugosa]